MTDERRDGDRDDGQDAAAHRHALDPSRIRDVARDVVRRIDVRHVAAGAVAGVAATVPMTLAMSAAQRTGLVGRLPPDTITRRAIARVGRPFQAASPRTTLVSAAAHVAVGATFGALFALGEDVLRPAGSETVHAVAYAALVWAASYAGVAPSLGLVSPPDDASLGRPVTMIAAHVVYGASLATALRLLDADA